MYKDGVLTIASDGKGMANSPYEGFSNISNIEVFESPGIFKIANRTTQVSTATLTGLPIAYVKDANGNNYFLTDDGNFYKNGVLVQDIGNFGWDLCIYNNYVIASVSSGGVGQLCAYGTLDASPTMFSGWKTGLSGVYYLKLLPARDGNLYITNGTSVAKISSFTAGAPTVAPTATLTTSVMTFPSQNAGITMIEIGPYILLGTQEANASFFNAVNGSIANLYLWDKADTKPTSLVSSLNETHVQAMISQGNRAYVMAGIRGNLYLSDTASSIKIKRIPYAKHSVFGSTTRIYPNAISLNVDGNLLIGTSTLGDSYNTDLASKHGVWEVALSKGYPTVFKQQISTGNTASTQALYIGFVQNYAGVLKIGWKDGSSYGLDETDFRLYASNAAVIESPMFVVGSRLKQKTFQQLEFLLGKDLVSGQEVTISYRTNLTDSYTQIGNFTYTSLGAVVSHNTKALIPDCEMVQIKISLTQPITTTFGNNIELIKIMIW